MVPISTSSRKKRLKLSLNQGLSVKGKRYKTGLGETKKLQDKLTYVDIDSGDEFMSNFSILGEKRFHLSQQKLILIGGDEASWIKDGEKIISLTPSINLASSI